MLRWRGAWARSTRCRATPLSRSSPRGPRSPPSMRARGMPTVSSPTSSSALAQRLLCLRVRTRLRYSRRRRASSWCLPARSPTTGPRRPTRCATRWRGCTPPTRASCLSSESRKGSPCSRSSTNRRLCTMERCPTLQLSSPSSTCTGGSWLCRSRKGTKAPSSSCLRTMPYPTPFSSQRAQGVTLMRFGRGRRGSVRTLCLGTSPTATSPRPLRTLGWTSLQPQRISPRLLLRIVRRALGM
mmetsp:Transcript_12161/g.28433  ORF Transcript_12161/g.28433 Transcript_12161/m.28433 type:complete len:241 (+) Transcript_12161:266-988(+)